MFGKTSTLETLRQQANQNAAANAAPGATTATTPTAPRIGFSANTFAELGKLGFSKREIETMPEYAEITQAQESYAKQMIEQKMLAYVESYAESALNQKLEATKNAGLFGLRGVKERVQLVGMLGLSKEEKLEEIKTKALDVLNGKKPDAEEQAKIESFLGTSIKEMREGALKDSLYSASSFEEITIEKGKANVVALSMDNFDGYMLEKLPGGKGKEEMEELISQYNENASNVMSLTTDEQNLRASEKNRKNAVETHLDFSGTEKALLKKMSQIAKVEARGDADEEKRLITEYVGNVLRMGESVRFGQYFNAHPDAAQELEKIIQKPKVWQQLKEVVTKWEGTKKFGGNIKTALKENGTVNKLAGVRDAIWEPTRETLFNKHPKKSLFIGGALLRSVTRNAFGIVGGLAASGAIGYQRNWLTSRDAINTKEEDIREGKFQSAKEAYAELSTLDADDPANENKISVLKEKIKSLTQIDRLTIELERLDPNNFNDIDDYSRVYKNTIWEFNKAKGLDGTQIEEISEKLAAFDQKNKKFYDRLGEESDVAYQYWIDGIPTKELLARVNDSEADSFENYLLERAKLVRVLKSVSDPYGIAEKMASKERELQTLIATATEKSAGGPLSSADEQAIHTVEVALAKLRMERTERTGVFSKVLNAENGWDIRSLSETHERGSNSKTWTKNLETMLKKIEDNEQKTKTSFYIDDEFEKKQKAERDSLYLKLAHRVTFLQSQMGRGKISFGEGPERINNQFAFTQQFNRAYAALIVEEGMNPDLFKQSGKRFAAVDKHLTLAREALTQIQDQYKRQQAIKGAVMATVIAGAGVLVAEELSGVAQEAWDKAKEYARMLKYWWDRYFDDAPDATNWDITPVVEKHTEPIVQATKEAPENILKKEIKPAPPAPPPHDGPDGFERMVSPKLTGPVILPTGIQNDPIGYALWRYIYAPEGHYTPPIISMEDNDLTPAEMTVLKKSLKEFTKTQLENDGSIIFEKIKADPTGFLGNATNQDDPNFNIYRWLWMESNKTGVTPVSGETYKSFIGRLLAAENK